MAWQWGGGREGGVGSELWGVLVGPVLKLEELEWTFPLGFCLLSGL